jgi:cytochrome b561
MRQLAQHPRWGGVYRFAHDAALAAVIAMLVVTFWQSMSSDDPNIFNDEFSYRFGFVFMAVLIVRFVRRRRASEPEFEPQNQKAPQASEEPLR